ncbi:unnamed protein product [Nippostrongylus brasiliensis]|uniref:WS_DGAT_C domain-containing protein n=1 Tax=Nippostrongylus brasiliensis TaxID=27835 RepID=A0A0N4Y509_NIPBR|nr:unnamed protein product [Nippostrongylus brasiliensis]
MVGDWEMGGEKVMVVVAVVDRIPILVNAIVGSAARLTMAAVDDESGESQVNRSVRAVPFADFATTARRFARLRGQFRVADGCP